MSAPLMNESSSTALLSDESISLTGSDAEGAKSQGEAKTSAQFEPHLKPQKAKFSIDETLRAVQDLLRGASSEGAPLMGTSSEATKGADYDTDELRDELENRVEDLECEVEDLQETVERQQEIIDDLEEKLEKKEAELAALTAAKETAVMTVDQSGVDAQKVLIEYLNRALSERDQIIKDQEATTAQQKARIESLEASLKG